LTLLSHIPKTIAIRRYIIGGLNEEHDDEKLKREIYCTQFFYEIWKCFEADVERITYYDCFGNILYEYSVDSNVCQEI
jgi:hypothetical protein